MSLQRQSPIKLACLLLLFGGAPAVAEEPKEKGFDFFGDFRLRLEQDWDYLQGDATQHDDRLRLRFRLRGGFDYQFGDKWSARVQARSGPNGSQQSPHITIHDFDGGSSGPYEFNFEYWFMRYQSGGFEGWAGRNDLSFWHQDDFFVFDNVTYAGAGGRYRHEMGQSALTFNLNYVALPVGMRDFSGTGLIGQVVYERDAGDSGFTIAGAFNVTSADADDPVAAKLLTENGSRDYSVFDLQFQYRSKIGDMPYDVGIDFTHNAENYDNEPVGSFSEFHKDHVDGHVVHFTLGEKSDAGDWQFGYYYAHQEALTTHSSYVQDDWVRWGTSIQARTTNMKGSEFRALYTVRPGFNIFARLFIVDAIDLLQAGDIALETGSRFRIEANIAF
jgi:hypothetical protein